MVKRRWQWPSENLFFIIVKHWGSLWGKEVTNENGGSTDAGMEMSDYSRTLPKKRRRLTSEAQLEMLDLHGKKKSLTSGTNWKIEKQTWHQESWIKSQSAANKPCDLNQSTSPLSLGLALWDMKELS